jgi:hypothetical protein
MVTNADPEHELLLQVMNLAERFAKVATSEEDVETRRRLVRALGAEFADRLALIEGSESTTPLAELLREA